MGFIYVGDALERQPNQRLFKTQVGRIMSACGLPDPETVESPLDQTITAIANVNDALEVVWNATMWEWRKKQIYFEMDTTEGYYDLPPDFHMFTREGAISGFRGEIGLPYADWAHLMTQYPWLVLGPDDVSPADIGMGGLLVEMIEDNDGYGIPQFYSLTRGKLVLFPFPDSSKYASADDWERDRLMLFSYFASFRTLSTDTDEIPLPHELLPALHFISLAFFKQAYEYPDFGADEQRGFAFLKAEVSKSKAAREREHDGFIMTPRVGTWHNHRGRW